MCPPAPIQVPLKLIRRLATVYLSDCEIWGKLHTTKGVAPGLYQILFVKNPIYRQIGWTEIIGNFINEAPVQKKQIIFYD